MLCVRASHRNPGTGTKHTLVLQFLFNMGYFFAYYSKQLYLFPTSKHSDIETLFQKFASNNLIVQAKRAKPI